MSFLKKLFKKISFTSKESLKEFAYKNTERIIKEYYPSDEIITIWEKYYLQGINKTEKESLILHINTHLIVKNDYDFFCGNIVMIHQVKTNNRVVLLLCEVDAYWRAKDTILGEIESDISFGYEHEKQSYP